jgi:RimJ/RimL family protein N-acetyltransferase
VQATTAGTYLLSMEHAAALQRLAADPRTAAAGIPFPARGAREFVEGQIAARADGSGYAFAIVDGGELVGVSSLAGVGGGEASRLEVWVALPFRGRGYATFGVRMLLEFAFRNLELERVRAVAPGSQPGAARVLAKHGFLPHPVPAASATDAGYELTRARWIERQSATALDLLHPALRVILAAELAAGNEVAETGGGWPDPDSVFVRLRHPFRTRPSPLPDEVTYTEPNDPHWWKADYSSRAPRHILAC